MVEIDFEQEDYEVIYKWPLSAKREKLRRAKAQKAKEKAERAKKQKAAPKPPPPPPPPQTPQIPDFGSEISVIPETVGSQNSSFFNRKVKITKKAFVRRPMYYDEDVEDCFTSKDDIIDLSLLSSDDEPPKTDKLKAKF